MPITIDPHPTTLSEDDVRRFEAEFGFPLPPGYRAFLLRCNGGVMPEPGDDAAPGFHAAPVPPLAAEDRWIAPDDFWDVALFHGLKREAGRYGDLREIYPVMRDWDHPPELLPIASSIGNAKYFLCTDGPRRGEILLAGEAWATKRADDLPITPDDYHRLCASFDAMLEALTFG